MFLLVLLFFCNHFVIPKGEADSIKTQHSHVGKGKKFISWVISVGWNAMAQSRDEVRTEVSDRTECLEGNWKEMINAGDVSVLL